MQDVLAKYGYPHVHPRAAWRLIPETISKETQLISSAWASLPQYANDAPQSQTVVIHLRCNDYILSLHSDYGILPHRFVMDRLPVDTKHVVIVRQEEKQENACLWSMQDLAQVLKDERHVNVTFRSSPDAKSDWLFLARAMTLFCAPSTFSLTAAWANPDKIWFATNGMNTPAVPNDPAFSHIRGGLTMVDIDFIPGKAAKNMTKQAVINYSRSSECLPMHGCLSALKSLDVKRSTTFEKPSQVDSIWIDERPSV